MSLVNRQGSLSRVLKEGCLGSSMDPGSRKIRKFPVPFKIGDTLSHCAAVTERNSSRERESKVHLQE